MRRPQADDEVCELSLAIAGDARHADDLTGMDLHRQVPELRCPAAAGRGNAGELKRAIPGRGWRAAGRPRQRGERSAEHQGEQAFFAGVPPWQSAGNAALPHHGDVVRASENFTELMGDEDDAKSLGPQLRDGLEQALTLLWRQYLSGLVENEHAGAGEKLLEDFHLLPVPDRKLADRHPGVDRKAKAVGQNAHAPQDIGGRDHGREVILEQRDILEHAQRSNQREILEHHTNAQRARPLGRGNRRGFAADADLAGIGGVVAVEDFCERALAGTVLAEEPKHLAAAHIECRDVISYELAEPFDDPACF